MTFLTKIWHFFANFKIFLFQLEKLWLFWNFLTDRFFARGGVVKFWRRSKNLIDSSLKDRDFFNFENWLKNLIDSSLRNCDFWKIFLKNVKIFENFENFEISIFANFVKFKFFLRFKLYSIKKYFKK